MTEKVYLVGGAVRDELLGIPHRERDWLVTGSTPASLQAQGYRRVGASFPVFLHPESNEEYTLARMERKTGDAHYPGFSVDFNPEVTLEEDLERRDLTINAMARDADGVLIDPFGGKADLEARILRHVSPSFADDPLRVLRVARFAARFASIGFVVHDTTMQLMRELTEAGKLGRLAPERVWREIRYGLEATRPSVFIQILRDCNALAQLLPELEALFGVPQPKTHHPEIDTGIHVMMAVDYAAAQDWPAEVVFAVLLHDLGKGVTEQSNWPSHVDHERKGLPLIEEVCDRFRVPGSFRSLALNVGALHLRCHRMGEMRPSRVMSLLEEADLMRHPEGIQSFGRACEADHKGRRGFFDRPYAQRALLQAALTAALSVRAHQLDTAGIDGPEIGERLRRARIAAIAKQMADH